MSKDSDSNVNVLLLRPFQALPAEESVVDPAYYMLGWVFRTLEHVFGIGSVTSIGDKRRWTEPLIPVSLYVNDDDWLSQVEELAGESDLIVLVAAATYGVGLELERLTKSHLCKRLVVILPQPRVVLPRSLYTRRRVSDWKHQWSWLVERIPTLPAVDNRVVALECGGEAKFRAVRSWSNIVYFQWGTMTRYFRGRREGMRRDRGQV